MSKKRYKQVGKTKTGKAIYKELDTGILVIEENFERVVKADKEDLKGAQFW